MNTMAETRGRETGDGGGNAVLDAARIIFTKTGALLPLFVIMAIYFSVASEHFLSGRNMSTIATQSVYFTLVVIAQAIVMITGGFDLSVGAALALTSITTSSVIVAVPGAGGIVLATGAGMLTGASVGAANGLLISQFRVSPLIVTLGMASVVSGLALIITGGVPIFNLPQLFKETLYTGDLAGVPVPWLVVLLVVGIAYIALYWHRLGRNWYAVGGNPVSAHIAGVPVKRALFLAYLSAGVLVGIAGVMLTARVGSGEPNLGGTFALQSIAAAVLGGISLRGGQGSLWGAILGAIFLVLLQNGLDLVGVSSYLQMIITGALLVFAVIVDHYWHKG
ncbi:ABC transporter permease [Arhodomonas aquaeolei]|uniref:ABC transporter permease n=2 Tax=Arhodomonas aquaeolei TaxID=2369 RepID=UPI00037E8AA9|nr:ABC transporter permease [Arhodomonas aquaeolei]MCS4504934.1 ABC transporter permease [Arhodomonas aquaeolei]